MIVAIKSDLPAVLWSCGRHFFLFGGSLHAGGNALGRTTPEGIS